MISDQIHLMINSTLFENSNLLDQIHQSIIDLQLNQQKDQIQRLLEESISLLDENLDLQTTIELFNLIVSYLSIIPNQAEEFYNSIYNNCQKNSNRLIFFAKLFSKNNPSQPIVKDFIQNLMDQIKIQITNYKETDKFLIENCEIPKIFLTDFIIDIVLMSELEEGSISLLYSFIFSQKKFSNSKIQKLSQKVLHKKYLKAIPENALTNKIFFDKIPNDFWHILISRLTKPAFQTFLQLINDCLKTKIIFSIDPLVNSILNGCIKYDYDIKTNDELCSFVLNSIDVKNIEINVLKYFEKNNIKLSQQKQINLNQSNNASSIVNVTFNVSIQTIFDATDLQTLESIFQNNFITENTDAFQQKTLWCHIFSIISSSDTKYSHQLLIKIKQRFEKYIDINNAYDIIETMIIDNYPAKNNGNDFLYDFLEGINYKYKKNFIEKSEVLLKKIIDNKVLPLPSFWKIFYSDDIKKVYNEENNENLFLMALKFSTASKITSKKIEKITIKPVKDQKSQEFIINFIKNKDIDYLLNIDDVSLNFILSTLLYNDELIKPEINGLNKLTILPFLAISLNYLNKDEYYSIFPKLKENTNEVLKVCEYLPKSKSILFIESVNSILSCDDFIFNFSLFSNNFIFKLLRIFINHLINNVYAADKLILLQAICKLSYKYTCNKNVKTLFDKNGSKIFNFIIKNKSQITNIDTLQKIGLDLNIFKLKQSSSIFFETIEQSSNYDEVINSVWFLNNLYTNYPKLKKANNLQNIFNFVNEAIKKGKWDDFDNLNQFIVQNRLENKIFFSKFNSINMKKIVTKMLSDQNLEKNNLFFELLFKIFMNDSNIASNFFIILFEKISNLKSYAIDLKNCLEQYKKLYENYNILFMNAFCNSFEYNSNLFVRKANIINTPNSSSLLADSIVSMLFNETNNRSCSFQAFYCLKNIASTFPFLLSNNPQKIFELVLPAFDFFILLFNNDNQNLNETDIRNMKIAISAFDFLYHILYSIKVLDSFVPWIYHKITSFSISQILAFIHILNSLFDTNIVNHVMVAISSKFHLPNIALILLEKEVQENIRLYYKNCIYSLLAFYYQTLNKLYLTKDLIYTDELRKNKNPFSHRFNKQLTIYPLKLKPIYYPIPNITEIKNFVDDISKVRHFWLEYENVETVNCDYINSFIDEYKKKCINNMKTKCDISSLIVPKINKINQIRLCANQPNWIYEYIVNNNLFEISQDHYNALQKVIKKINTQTSQNDKEIQFEYNDVDIDDFFASDFNQKKLIFCILQDFLLNDNEKIISLINSIIKNKTGFQLFLEIVCNDQLLTTDNAKKLIKIMTSIKNNNLMNNDNCNYLIDLSLSPELRNDKLFLSWLSDILNNFKELPGRAIHFICFMIINQLDSQKITDLCKKIKHNDKKMLLKVVVDFIVSNKFKSKTMFYSIFNDIIEMDHSLKLSIEIQKILNIIDDAIRECHNFIFMPTNIISFICNLFNIIAPKRNEQDINISKNESTQIDDKSFLNSAHPDLIKTNPTFWNFYEKHLKFLNKVVYDDKKYLKKLIFLEEFPELTSFMARFNDFNSKMNAKINLNNTLKIKVDRSNVLPNSYTFLKNKTRDEWLRCIQVEYIGESGNDLGGITRDWFSSIVKELFNPNNALFVLTEKNNYMPNHLSGINPEHIEFYKFTGKLIARAIIQGQCIDAHFTKSFYRQILQSTIQFNDFEDIDENIYNSFQMILNEDVEQLELNFTIDVDEYGIIKNILLKENGDKIEVTNKNKKEYVDLYVDYRLRKSIIDQINAFCEGFHWLIPANEIKIFTPKELDLIICGKQKIDIDDLINNITFIHPYTKDHPVIILFLKVLKKWNSNDLSKFLMFLTGSSQIPVNGFKEKNIKIAPGGDKNRLCVAHTCFKTLDLPQYETEDEMNSKLLRSIQESYFGII